MRVGAGGISIPGDRAIRGGPAGFSPLRFSGCVLWLRSDLGLTLNQTSVSFPDAIDNAAWTKLRCSVTPDATADPFGTNLADKIIEDNTATNTHTFNQAVTNGSATLQHTTSIYAKAGTRSWVALSDAVAGSAYYNLGNGTLGTVAGGTAAIQNVGNGWYLCSFTASGITSFNCFMATGDNAANYTGDGVSFIYVVRANVQQGRVSAWADQSGAGNTVSQATAASQPLWVPTAQVGKPVVRFDGVDDDLFRNATNLWGAGAYGFAIAFKGTSTANYLLSDGTATTGVGFGNVGGNRCFTHQNVENHADAAVVATAETWVGSRAAASAPTLLVNGVSQSLTNTVNTVNDPGGAGVLAVGSFGHLSNFIASDIYEVIAYNRDLTATEQTRLANYLRAEWGTP